MTITPIILNNCFIIYINANMLIISFYAIFSDVNFSTKTSFLFITNNVIQKMVLQIIVKEKHHLI